MSNSLTLFNCTDNEPKQNWQVVTDGVMGGKSEGSISHDNQGKCVFSGNISLENNGGFSMVRCRINAVKLAKEYRRFSLKVKGDGRQYQFRVKSVSDQRHSYGFHFTTNGEWQQILIPFDKLLPVFRGKLLDLPVYDGKNLEELAFLTGKQPGNFELKISNLVVA